MSCHILFYFIVFLMLSWTSKLISIYIYIHMGVCTGLWCKSIFFCKKENGKIIIIINGWSLWSTADPIYPFIIILYMFLLSLLAPVSLGFLWPLNRVMLILTKTLYIVYFSVWDVPVPWLIPTASQGSYEMKFLQRNLWLPD